MNVGHGIRTAVLTLIALLAFAGNSILCRLALGESSIDAASFTAVRLLSGAATLLVIAGYRHRGLPPSSRGDWVSAVLLFSYAAGFSFAYVSLSASTGALILFGAGQITMILGGLWLKERTLPLEWLGLVIVAVSMAILLFPGLSAPSPSGAALMAIAGSSWGLYSLRGRGSLNPLETTAGNFSRTIPLTLGMTLIIPGEWHVSGQGVLLATVSGALASGIGYAVWYAALQGLTATRAATVQLSVPVLTALGAVIFLAETITARLSISTVIMLAGIGLTLMGRSRSQST